MISVQYKSLGNFAVIFITTTFSPLRLINISTDQLTRCRLLSYVTFLNLQFANGESRLAVMVTVIALRVFECNNPFETAGFHRR